MGEKQINVSPTVRCSTMVFDLGSFDRRIQYYESTEKVIVGCGGASLCDVARNVVAKGQKEDGGKMRSDLGRAIHQYE